MKCFASLVAGLGLVLLAACLSPAATVNVDVYTGHTLVGGGAPYSGFVGSFTASDIQFGTDTGFAWHPFGLTDFGADITTSILLPAAITHTFTVSSDDGALLFIDGALVVDNGGPHAPGSHSETVSLAPGLHSLEVQFFECCGGPSGVDVNLPEGGAFVPVPAAVWSGMGMLLSLGAVRALRRRFA